MASIKIEKPRYSFGAARRSYSESHQESSGYSNYSKSASASKVNQSSYNYPAHDTHVGLSMHSCEGDGYDQAWTDQSTNHYAQAQCAQPSPAIHVVETMKMQESHKGEAYGKYSTPTPATAAHSEFAMHKEEHMMGKPNQGYANTQPQFSSSGQGGKYGLAMHKEEHMMAKAHQGWANNQDHLSGKAQANQYGLAMHEEEHMTGKSGQDWPNKPTQYSDIAHGNQYGLATHSGGNMVGKMEQGWANEQNHHSSPRGNQYGLGMHKEEHMVGKMGNDWANKLNHYSDPAHSNHGQSMYKEQEVNAYEFEEGGVESGWASKSSNHLNSARPNNGMHSMFGRHEENEFASDSNNYLNPIQTNKANHIMHKEEHMMGKMDHGYANSPNKLSGPTRTNHGGLGMYKPEHRVGEMDHVVVQSPTRVPSPIGANQFGQSMYNEHGSAISGYGGNKGLNGANQSGYSAHSHYEAPDQHAWAENAQNGLSGSHASRSIHGVAYGQDHENSDQAVNEIMDEILTKYPSHGVSSGYATTNCASQNQFGSYAKQQSSFGEPAQYGNAAQSSSSKFEMKKEMKAGYMGNVKQEYSHSSSSKSLMSNGGSYTNGIGCHDDYHF